MKLKILFASAILAVGGAFWAGCGGSACDDLASAAEDGGCAGSGSAADCSDAEECAAQCYLDSVAVSDVSRTPGGSSGGEAAAGASRLEPV